MKAFTTAVLLSAASGALAQEQQVLKVPSQISNMAEQANQWIDTISKVDPAKASTKVMDKMHDALSSLTEEGSKLWDEMNMMFPESMNKAKFFSQPKPATRRHDSEWDHIIKGADIQSLWVENEEGVKERAIHGKLDNFNMRVKKVDPAALGVDTVKQYSGYLDDEEEDKHLFYCMFTHCAL